jgi:UDP-2-acetamido-2,6-beta-L-arabino-hexul-4-ose reductase
VLFLVFGGRKYKDSYMKIGITGQTGFIGTHLHNYLGLQENIERIDFEDEFFQDQDKLDIFVSKCDVIVHLAAMNRHGVEGVIYKTNIDLTQKLIDSLNRTGKKTHILISSSTQELRDNEYGRSKKKAREMLRNWARKNDVGFTGLVISNVFGPFGKPYYNSFIATFSHRIMNNETPEIQIDSELDLIYVQDLIHFIYKNIINKNYSEELLVPHIATIKVSDVLERLLGFNKVYSENGVFPKINNYFELCLFNTFRSYLPKNIFPRTLKPNTDDRGCFVEIVKTLGQGQFSFSTTKPNITRGNHFHLRKIERFAVIKGKARIQLRKIGSNEVIDYYLDGTEPAYVDMPVWYTHNITNIGDDELVTLFWINEFFDPNDPDTYYEKV